jgi:septum formation protein
MSRLILASSSTYRKNLLQRLQLEFVTASPNIDESRITNESPEQMVKRLALAKASVVAKLNPNSLIIGSDQLATCDNQIIGKPGSFEKAVEQLTHFSGKTVFFITGVAVLKLEDNIQLYEQNNVRVTFRNLNSTEIERYVTIDKPFDCAGSFKIESLGTCLFEQVVSDDPTSLEGLPLIVLSRLLRKAGVAPLSF